jgi:ubiquinone biosynthesis protein UbiJ
VIALQGTADPAAVNGRYELRIGADVFTVDGTSGSVRVRRGTADKPEATLTTDADTLHDVALGIRPLTSTAESGDLRLDGDPQAIAGLTSLLQALISSPTLLEEPEHAN